MFPFLEINMRERSHLDKFIVRRCRYSFYFSWKRRGYTMKNIRERCVVALIHIAGIADALVFLCTLGQYTTDLRDAVVFHDFEPWMYK